MKFSALILATAAIIATVGAKELGRNERCRDFQTKATCKEYIESCTWEDGKLHHCPKLIRFHYNLMMSFVCSTLQCLHGDYWWSIQSWSSFLIMNILNFVVWYITCHAYYVECSASIAYTRYFRDTLIINLRALIIKYWNFMMMQDILWMAVHLMWMTMILLLWTGLWWEWWFDSRAVFA